MKTKNIQKCCQLDLKIYTYLYLATCNDVGCHCHLQNEVVHNELYKTHGNQFLGQFWFNDPGSDWIARPRSFELWKCLEHSLKGVYQTIKVSFGCSNQPSGCLEYEVTLHLINIYVYIFKQRNKHFHPNLIRIIFNCFVDDPFSI